MNNVEKSIVASSLIGIIFTEYKAGELDKAGELVRKRLAKYMRRRAKTNPKEFLIAIKITDTAWRETVNHFAEINMRIEAKSTIMEIFNYFEDGLSKYANVRDKHIENFMIQATDDAEAEFNSDKVVDYLVEKLGLPKRKNAFHTRFAILKENRILEGK